MATTPSPSGPSPSGPSTSGAPATISAGYRAAQAKLHADHAEYGMASVHFAPLVAQVVRANKVRQILDYGAGKGRLAEALQAQLKEKVSAAS